MSDSLTEIDDLSIPKENDETIQTNNSEEKMKKFRDLLMRENLNIVAKLKKYKKTDFRRKIVLDQLKELKKLSELSKMWVSVPFIKQTFDSPVVTVDSSRAGSNIDALRLAINELGWKEYPNGCSNKPCHVVWNSCNFNENRNNVGSFVNKYPGITQCLHKVAFSRILETMRTLFPSHYNFYPLTWYLPHQMMDFTMYCKKREAANKKSKYYIVKPDAGTQGEGIYLIQKPQDYKITSKTYVVQEYLANPLLLDGYKFDLRIYAILLNLDPLKIYLCNEGLARFCTKRYVPPSSNNLNISFMHLTNYSLNKKSNEFVHSQNLDSGSKRTVSSVFAFLEAEGYKVSSVWQKLEELVYKTILAIVPQLKVHYVNEIIVKSDNLFSNNQFENFKDRPNCFQILGFDVLIMDDLTPILLEVNSNPSMRLDCEMEIAPGICEYYVSKVDVKIKKPLVRDTLKLLQQDICNKFKLDMKEFRDSGWYNRVNDVLVVDNETLPVKENSNIADKESSEKDNVSEICRKWSMESEFGPHFVEIAKQNNILPKHFEISRPNSVNDLLNGEKTVNVDPNSEIQVTVTGTSPQIRRKQQQKRYDQLAKEKSWLAVSKVEKNDTDYQIVIESEDSRNQKSGNQNQEINSCECTLQSESCLTLISTDSYKYLFDDLRILEETTIVFYNAMGHRYSENMGATAFRTFGRQCKLHLLGFNHAMIDLIYVEVQRRWAFINNYDNKQGLCYQAFLEAFFRIAFAKFIDLSKGLAVQNLIDHCKRSIGSENFNWTKTLYPLNDNKSQNEHEIRNGRQLESTKKSKILGSQNPNQKHDIKSYSSESSSENFNGNSNDHSKEKQKSYQLEVVQSRYELMKAIHEMYRKKLRKSSSPKFENDSDSVKSLPGNKNDENWKIKKSSLPRISRIMSSVPQSQDSSRNFSTSNKTYTYEKPQKTVKTRESMIEKKFTYQAHKDFKPMIPNTTSLIIKEDPHLGYKKMANSYEKPYYSRIPMESAVKTNKPGSHQTKGRQLSPINAERMKQLISVYGADSQDFLKKSLDKMNKKFPLLKPI